MVKRVYVPETITITVKVSKHISSTISNHNYSKSMGGFHNKSIHGKCSASIDGYY